MSHNLIKRTKLLAISFSKQLSKVLQIIFLQFVIVQTSNAMEQPKMPPAQVSIVLAKERLLAPTTQVTGSVVSLNDSKISTQVPGELTWLATVGSAVKKGDIIARIKPTLIAIDFQMAEAELEKSRADLAFRQQEVKRFKTLANRDNTSKARLQEEIAKRNMLLQDIRIGQAKLALTKHNLSQIEIKAPFGGTIVHRLASKGEFLSAGTQVLRLVDTYHREISLNAPMSLLPYLSNGMTVQVSTNLLSDKVTVNAIVPVGDEISRMVEIRLNVLNDHWIVGMPITIHLPNAPALTRITIPRDALIIKGSDVYVFRIDQSMKAERLDAKIEAIDGDWVAIKTKLAEGDQIIIRGGERLMPEQTVSILQK